MNESHRVFVIDFGRQRIEKVFRDGEQLGEGSLPAVMSLIVAPNSIARLESADSRADRLDNPGHVPPHDKREGQVFRQLTAANQGVHRIDANRGGLDLHIGRTDRRSRKFAELDVLRWTDAVDVSSFHGCNSVWRLEP